MRNGTLPTLEAALQARIDRLETALRLIENEVYGRPEPYCRNVADRVIEVLGPPEMTGDA